MERTLEDQEHHLKFTKSSSSSSPFSLMMITMHNWMAVKSSTTSRKPLAGISTMWPDIIHADEYVWNTMLKLSLWSLLLSESLRFSCF
ncbi:hypothetical protein L208DRAFT_529759 [Tricholoma matsutake]|nr:hypothetical protein L208DRAFT_529759 [Tricholoma matsutake 945]